MSKQDNIVFTSEEKNLAVDVSHLNINNFNAENQQQTQGLAQQATLIFENGQNCLQLHLKPETNTSNSNNNIRVKLY